MMTTVLLQLTIEFCINDDEFCSNHDVFCFENDEFERSSS